jgi:nucleotide-binding universal stress UspA family protein
MLSRLAGADLTIAHVHKRGHAGESALLLDEAERLLPYAVRATLCAVEARWPVHGLHDLAESERADLLVVGATTRSSLELHAVGSVPVRLLHAAPCAVAVAPAGFAGERDPGVRVVGVAFDATPEAHEALATASELALQAGAAIKLIGVAEKRTLAVGVASLFVPDPEEHLRDALLRELEAAADELPDGCLRHAARSRLPRWIRRGRGSGPPDRHDVPLRGAPALDPARAFRRSR